MKTKEPAPCLPVETIGDSAFYGCKALTKITFEDRDGALQSIGTKAFSPSKPNLKTTVIVYSSSNNIAVQTYAWDTEGRITTFEYK